ncbi:MAG TPA: alpha/beta hydrolase, partial [Patescibacteria group bacterium]|nr:alpha/beta hydrolase [Patescibacteria group bacterium]
FLFKNSFGDVNEGDIRFRDDGVLKPAVIVLHGFKGFKDWGFFPFVSEQFALKNAIAVNFNFSLNGVNVGEKDMSNNETFSRNTISREVSEALEIIQAFKRGELAPYSECFKTWSGEIFLMGHSRGGGVAILTAARCEDIIKLVLWNSVSTFDRYTERQKKAWREAGYIEMENARTKQMFTMKVSYLDEIEQHAEELDVVKNFALLRMPVKIIHGEQDVTVNVREAHKLATANQASVLKIIPKTGHTFGAVHPFEGAGPTLLEAIRETCDFFNL